jgi:S1-C subfamily serine protease
MLGQPQLVSAEYGLQVTDVLEGTARKAGMRAGDVIVNVGSARTQSFEELQQALGASRGPTEISFVNGYSRKVEKLTVTPVDGKIGVAVVPVALR